MLELLQRTLPVVRGAEAAECGLACMTMVARYHGHDVDLNGMRQRYSLSLSGATLRSVMDLAGQMGFTTRALRVDVESLARVRTPAILHWDMNHFVVLKAVRPDRVVVHDPALGRRAVGSEELSKHFTGVVLNLCRYPRCRRCARACLHGCGISGRGSTVSGSHWSKSLACRRRSRSPCSRRRSTCN